MRHVSAPRPGGALAAIDAAPDADVVIMGHVGFPAGLARCGGCCPSARRSRSGSGTSPRRPSPPTTTSDRLALRLVAALDAWVEGAARGEGGGGAALALSVREPQEDTMATVQSQETQSGNGSSGGTTTIMNPASGKPVRDVPTIGREGTIALVERARRAQPSWEALGFAGRAAVLRDLRKWLVDNRQRVLTTLTEESGKPWVDAQIELFYVADGLTFWGKKAPKYLRDETARPHSPLLLGRKLVNRYRPYGVVGVIGPWNYPLVNNFGDAIPALMAGNTVVLKPAGITPLSSLLIADGLREVGAPEDVFLVANGSGSEVGGALVEHVDMLHFTGSTEVGKQLALKAAERLLPLTLELGGKDPMIVLDDANLDRAANAAVWGALQNGGQTCISVERVYVEGAIYDEFVSKVVEKVRELRQGGATGPGASDVAAVTSARSGGRARGPRARRRRQGREGAHRRQAARGRRHLLRADRAHRRRPHDEVHDRGDLRRDPADHAGRERGGGDPPANDSPFGLDASVFGGDLERAERVARRIESGGVVVNDAIANYFATEIPLGGAKESGVGARHGAMGIQKFCQRQNLVVTRFGLKKELYYFPYSKLTSKLLDLSLVGLFGWGRKR